MGADADDEELRQGLIFPPRASPALHKQRRPKLAATLRPRNCPCGQCSCSAAATEVGEVSSRNYNGNEAKTTPRPGASCATGRAITIGETDAVQSEHFAVPAALDHDLARMAAYYSTRCLHVLEADAAVLSSSNVGPLAVDTVGCALFLCSSGCVHRSKSLGSSYTTYKGGRPPLARLHLSFPHSQESVPSSVWICVWSNMGGVQLDGVEREASACRLATLDVRTREETRCDALRPTPKLTLSR